jgi:hypothetical protein
MSVNTHEPVVAHCYEAMRGWAAMHNGRLPHAF